MKRRSLPPRRAYSALHTLSSASPRWRMMWNLSNRIAACSAFSVATLHHDEPDFAALPWPQPSVELRHARLGTVFAAEPDRPLAHQVADHDAIDVPLADRDLVDADRSGSRRAGPLDLHPHVLQRLDCFPIELQLLGDIADRSLPAATPDIESKALGEMRIVRQKIQPLAFHAGASTARDAPHLQLQNDPQPGARKVANSS